MSTIVTVSESKNLQSCHSDRKNVLNNDFDVWIDFLAFYSYKISFTLCFIKPLLVTRIDY